MKLSILISFFLILKPSKALKKDFAMPEYGNALTRGLVEIIEKFYMNRTNTLNVYHASENLNDLNKEINLDLVNEVLYQVQSKVVVQLEGYLDLKDTNRKRIYNIIFVDSYESFWQFFLLMSPLSFEYQGFYMIVLTKYSNHQYETMMKIFQHLWGEFIINVNIIWLAPENENEAFVYTYFPYTRFFCGNALPIYLNQFIFGKWQMAANFFPDKVSNMFNCPLNVVTVMSPPFMVLSENRFDGIDGTLLRVLSQRMNFSVKIIRVESQGTVYLNGSSSGAFQMVIEKEANLTIGYVSSTAIRNYYMKSSYIYYTSNLMWMIPPGRLFTSFEKLFKPFRAILWTCILVVFILSYFAIFLIRFQTRSIQNFILGQRNYTPSLNVINIFFGGSLQKLPNRNFARFILAQFMIYCLIIRSSYQGEIFDSIYK